MQTLIRQQSAARRFSSHTEVSFSQICLPAQNAHQSAATDEQFAQFADKAQKLGALFKQDGDESNFQFLAVDKDVDELHGTVEARAMFEFIAPRMKQRHIALEEAAERGDLVRLK